MASFTEEEVAAMAARSVRNRKKSGSPPPAKAKKYKHKNKPTEYNGRTYHSKAEAERAKYWDLRLKAGAADEVVRQPKYVLLPGKTSFIRKRDMLEYTPDFDIRFGDTWISEDVKGQVKQRDRDIWKLWQEFGLHPLHIVTGGKVVQVIEPIQ